MGYILMIFGFIALVFAALLLIILHFDPDDVNDLEEYW